MKLREALLAMTVRRADLDVSGRRFIVDSQLKHNTVAIAHAGELQVAGVVNMLRSRDGQDFPSFFTGHAGQEIPIIFMSEPADPGRLRFELTGKTFGELWSENEAELGVYGAFAEKVFKARAPGEAVDAYVLMNAALWMKASKLFRPEQFTAEIIDPEIGDGAAQICLAAKKAVEHFVAEAKAAAAAGSIQ